MQRVKTTGKARVMLCAGAAGAALLAAGAASAQAYSPDYPPPQPRGYAQQPAYGDYPAPPPGYQDQRASDPRANDPRSGDPRYADPRYADQSYQSYQAYQDPRNADPRYRDPRYQDPRYQDPRTMDPEQARAYRRWLNRYYGQGYANAPQQASNYPQAPNYPQAQAYPPAEAPRAAPARARTPAAPAPAAPTVEPARAVAPAVAAIDAPVPHLPHRLVEAAQAYADYVHKTGAISAAFKSGDGVASAVRTASSYEMHQFQEGAIAYAAMTALQEPSFVEGARQLLREGDRGADFAAQLAAYPQAALNIQGADLAAARAATALRRHGEHLVSAGAQVKQAAYDVQHSEWSKAQVNDPDGRLAAAKVTSNRRAELKGEDAPELIKAVLAEPAGDRGASASPIVTRALAIAALAVLGQIKGDEDPNLVALTTEPRSADCFKMAKLNLFQCLSVARPHYEDIFCLGEHGMMETGQCVVKAAGYTPIPTTVARAGGSSEAARK